MAAYVCCPGTWEVEAGGSRTQGHARLYGKFETGRDYLRPYLKQNKTDANQPAVAGDPKMQPVTLSENSSPWTLRVKN